MFQPRHGDLSTSRGRAVEHAGEAMDALNVNRRTVSCGAVPPPQHPRPLPGVMADRAPAIHRPLDVGTERGRTEAPCPAMETRLKKEGLAWITQGNAGSRVFTSDASHTEARLPLLSNNREHGYLVE